MNLDLFAANRVSRPVIKEIESILIEEVSARNLWIGHVMVFVADPTGKTGRVERGSADIAEDLVRSRRLSLEERSFSAVDFCPLWTGDHGRDVQELLRTLPSRHRGSSSLLN